MLSGREICKEVFSIMVYSIELLRINDRDWMKSLPSLLSSPGKQETVLQMKAKNPEWRAAAWIFCGSL